MKPPAYRSNRILGPAHALTHEARWLDRRTVLRGLGFFGAAAALGPACTEAADTHEPVQPAAPADVLARFPAPRNRAYEPGRPLTPEAIGSRHNNYYELTTDKERVWKLADSYPRRPWVVRYEVSHKDRPLPLRSASSV